MKVQIKPNLNASKDANDSSVASIVSQTSLFLQSDSDEPSKAKGTTSKKDSKPSLWWMSSDDESVAHELKKGNASFDAGTEKSGASWLKKPAEARVPIVPVRLCVPCTHNL